MVASGTRRSQFVRSLNEQLSCGEMTSLCLFTASPDLSGMGTHMLALARELRRDFEITFVCPPTQSGLEWLHRAEQADLRVLPIDVADGGRIPRAFLEWLHFSQPDVFHSHAGIGWEGHIGIGAARAAGVPVIVRTEHLPYLLTDAEQQSRHRLLMAQLDGLICVSAEAADSFASAGVSPALLRVVRNGIPILRPVEYVADVPDLRRQLGLPPTVRLAITVARLSEQKGHRVLLEALPALLKLTADVHLVWVGDGPLGTSLLAQAHRLGVQNNVHFLGHRSDVSSLLANSDVFVLPSFFEGLPLVVLEAMAAALPVVATEVVGTKEAVIDHVTGRLVPADAAVPLAEAIADTLADPQRAAAWGRAGRERVARHFSAGRMARETSAIYHELLLRRQRTAKKISAAGDGRRGALAARPLGPSGECMDRVRLGFVGAGSIARRHLESVTGFEDVVVSAIADVDLAAAMGAAARFGGTPYSNVEEMLDREQLDAMYICVPPFAHGQAEEAALSRSLPFFVEKPIGVDLGVAERIAAQVAQKGLITAVGYHWRYLDTMERARELVAEKPARLAVGYWLDSTPPPAWWPKQSLSGGQLIEQTTHIFDVIRFLMGEVTTVSAIGGRTPREAFPDCDIAESSVAMLQLASGAVATVASTCLLGWRHRAGLHLFSDGMALELSEFDLMVDVGQGRPIQLATGDPVQREDRDFIDAVAGRPNRIRSPYSEALLTHRLAVAAARAATSGGTVLVPDEPIANPHPSSAP